MGHKIDITRCQGDGCLVKDKCYRFVDNTEKESKSIHQILFVDPPFDIKDGVFSCEMYWGENNNRIMDQFEDILNGKHNNT